MVLGNKALDPITLPSPAGRGKHTRLRPAGGEPACPAVPEGKGNIAGIARSSVLAYPAWGLGPELYGVLKDALLLAAPLAFFDRRALVVGLLAFGET